MSDSRLEKFIYAICSMDVSDLPVPLSRIEKLWNCLITGETPDFEPISRNEKYLMAMLDRYDISNLPAPMSRGEKLLYKIAVGETDLSDVPGYLSRYEELLKYLIENGGIGFEYVLYTLNQSLSTLYATVEKPVKSAILIGKTLVTNYYSGVVELTATGSWVENHVRLTEVTLPVKHSTDYLFIVDVLENSLVGDEVTNVSLRFGDTNTTAKSSVFTEIKTMPLHQLGVYKFILTTKSDLSNAVVFDRKQLSNLCTSGKIKFRYIVIEYQDGMENWDIPYFEGMQSVKLPVLTTTGKNLFPDVNFSNNHIYKKVANGIQIINDSERAWVPMFDNLAIPMPKGDYVLSAKLVEGEYTGGVIRLDYADGTISREFWFSSNDGSRINNKFNNTSDKILKRINVWNPKGNAIFQFQLEQGSAATPYKPYKTNILTVNEEVTLRGIGDVKDMLDLLTGEVTEYFEEIVLDGSNDERWEKTSNEKENTVRFLCTKYSLALGGKILCDRFASEKTYETDKESIEINGTMGFILIRVNKNRANTVEEFTNYLSQNPLMVYCESKNPTIKTVDLTTVDQDGQSTKLKTFNDITYAEINADNIIPSVDVEVATKISETLSTLGLEHHDISETQNKLSQTIDEQSENTDATMMATTEIYEQTL